MPFEIELTAPVVIAAISAGVAVLSFLLNFLMVRRQARMQLEGLRHSVDRELLQWGRRAIDALAEAQRLIACQPHMTDTAFEQDRLAAMRDLSATADEGRFFFPNLIIDGHGEWKESAFQGHRQPALHALIFAYYTIEHWRRAAKSPEAAMTLLWRCRRLVVSEVQVSVDPRRRQRVITTLSKETGEPQGANFEDARTLAVMLDDLIPGVLKSSEDRIWNAVEAHRRRTGKAAKSSA